MPELWNMTKCICMASALAIVGIAASILMLVRKFLHPPTVSTHTLLTVPCMVNCVCRIGSRYLRWQQDCAFQLVHGTSPH